MNLKSFLLPGLGAATLALSLLLPGRLTGQGAANEADSAALLLSEVRTQQKVIAENQDKIDASLAAVAEDLRTARIFVSRTGGAAK